MGAAKELIGVADKKINSDRLTLSIETDFRKVACRPFLCCC